MRPKYEFGKITMIDELLTGSSPFTGGNPLVTAVTRARGEGFWLDPETLAKFCPHTAARDARTREARRAYESENSYALYQEKQALDTSRALESWARAYDPDAHAKDLAARKLEAEKADFIARRCAQLEIEEQLEATIRRSERAEREWQEQFTPKPAATKPARKQVAS